MKKGWIMLLAIGVVLVAVVGCIIYGKTMVGDTLTVRVENRSDVDLSNIAASYSIDDKTLGSQECRECSDILVPKKNDVYVFEFTKEQLSYAKKHLENFRIDIFAEKEKGEDYTSCGSAIISSPKIGGTYTLTLNGTSASELFLFPVRSDDKIKIFLPGTK